MDKVTVFKFKWYSIADDKSRDRYGTREAIESIKATVIEDSAMEVDASKLDDNEFLKD